MGQNGVCKQHCHLVEGGPLANVMHARIFHFAIL